MKSRLHRARQLVRAEIGARARFRAYCRRKRSSSMAASVLDQVRAAAAKKVLFLPHAVRQMSRPSRMISPAEINAAITAGELVGDYPEDVRGHSCLLLGSGDSGRPIHIVCAPKPDYLAIITAYIPHPDQWSADFRQRK